MLEGTWFLSKIPCFVSADDTMNLPYVGSLSVCAQDIILLGGWKAFCLFPVTPLDVVKIRLQAQKNPFPKGMLTIHWLSCCCFCRYKKSNMTTSHLKKYLSGKCFVYCNGLMDHICVCENGNSKAWYKAPGRFSGTLVNCSHTICIIAYKNINRSEQSCCNSQTVFKL